MNYLQKEEKPSDLAAALKSCNRAVYPNIFQMLHLFLTLPITTCECERSNSALRRLKTWTRSTMEEDRLNGLALMMIHRQVGINVNSIIDKFASKNRRRWDLDLVL